MFVSLSLLKKVTFILIPIGLLFGLFNSSHLKQRIGLDNQDSLTGRRVELPAYWGGYLKVKSSIPILLMAGHADSQNMNGAGTAGEAVDLMGASPMDPTMRDELFWNLWICDEVVKLGRKYGFNISSYDPGIRKIINEKDPRTNWSVGSQHASKGGYTLEIHFDAYGKYGFGSGLIPAVSTKLNTLDESLAISFGRYPLLFRGGLGAPRRGIRILEIGKLEGDLERKLRNSLSRKSTVKLISQKIIDAFLVAFSNENFS